MVQKLQPERGSPVTRPTGQLGSSDLARYEARARARRELAVDLSSRGQSSTEMYRLDLAPKESYQLGFRRARGVRSTEKRQSPVRFKSRTLPFSARPVDL